MDDSQRVYANRGIVSHNENPNMGLERVARAFLVWNGPQLRVFHTSQIDNLRVSPVEGDPILRRQDRMVDPREFEIEFRTRSFALTYGEEDPSALDKAGLPLSEIELYDRIEQLEHQLSETQTELRICQLEREKALYRLAQLGSRQHADE
jgi:hypothetical protein